MSKLKFDKKWKGDQAYSPTHEWEDEASCTVENITIEEPSSPMSTYSLTFNGEKWIIPIDDDIRQKISCLQGHLHQYQVRYFLLNNIKM